MRLLCPILVLVSLATYAQQPLPQANNQPAAGELAIPADAPSREDILKLFEVMQVHKTMDSVVAATTQQTKVMVDEMMKEKFPNSTLEQREDLQNFMQETLNQILGPDSIKEMIEVMIPVYRRHLTKPDLDAMVAFYSSPTGQKIIRDQPQMIVESMQALAPLQKKWMSSMISKAEEHANEMARSLSRQKGKQP